MVAGDSAPPVSLLIFSALLRFFAKNVICTCLCLFLFASKFFACDVFDAMGSFGFRVSFCLCHSLDLERVLAKLLVLCDLVPSTVDLRFTTAT